MAKLSIPKTLKPCPKPNIPRKTPLLSDIFKQKKLQKWPIKVKFPGWRKPHQNWANWVEKLSLKFAKTWELTGICDGILSSLHEIKPNPNIILGLIEYWCPETNTFHFPWAEATFTLEDVNVLFGLPVLGENVNLIGIDASYKNLESKLYSVKNALLIIDNGSNGWIKYFNEENDEMEHVGFLAFWLSMYVFPLIDDRTVGSHVFPVAIRLARGARIGLAPAVLACLYQNITFLTDHAADFDSAMKEVSVPGPFQILQLWAFERFPLLGSKLAKPLSLGEPRIGRWDKVSFKGGLVDVRKELRSSSESFCWQPYALELKNWRYRSMFNDLDVEKVLSGEYSGVDDDKDDDLRAFRVCLMPQELIGIDCNATYQPHRVMMQFVCGGHNKVNVEPEVSRPFESGNVRLLNVEKPSTVGANKLQEEPISAHGITIVEGREQECNDDDQKRLILTSDLVKTELKCIEGSDPVEPAATVSPVSKILNVSGSDNATTTRDEVQSLEGLIVMDSDDEMVEKADSKDVIRSRSSTKKLKRRIGDSADYPLFINEYSSRVMKKVKKSGISAGNPIDVENYWLS